MQFLTVALLGAMFIGKEAPSTVPVLARAAEIAIAELGPVNGTTEAETLARLLVTADEESHWDPEAEGDHGHSHCAMQVWAPRETTDTPEKCMHAALAVMHESRRMCGAANALGQYCGGCDRPAAKRISEHRIKRAKLLVQTVRNQPSMLRNKHDVKTLVSDSGRGTLFDARALPAEWGDRSRSWGDSRRDIRARRARRLYALAK